MSRIHLLRVAIMSVAFGYLAVPVYSAATLGVLNIEGRYERAGVVDRVVEDKYRGLGLVLVPPVYIDELLTCPQRGTRGDSEFIFSKQNSIGYVVSLPKAGVACALAELGSLVELVDGVLLLRRSVTLTGEGSRPIHGDQEDRFSKEESGGVEWLVVDTRIVWTKRSLFSSKKVEYRSLVRFLKLPAEPETS